MKSLCIRSLTSVWAANREALTGLIKELSPKGLPGA